MDCYLKSIDYDIWNIVMHGDIIPRKKVDDRFIDMMRSEEQYQGNGVVYGFPKSPRGGWSHGGARRQ